MYLATNARLLRPEVTDKAVMIAQENYPPLTGKQLANIERLRRPRNGVTLCAHLPAGEQSATL